MPQWPNEIPHDLDKARAEVEGWLPTTSDQNRWGAIQRWLENHQVEAPEKLPQRPEQKFVEGRYGGGGPIF